MLQLVYGLILFVAIVFWVIQMLDLLFRDVHFFESHTHKLTWFLVLVVSFIVGAVWYSFWKQAVVTAWNQSHKS